MNKRTKKNSELQIRRECLRPFADDWIRPTGAEIKALLKYANLTGDMAAKLVGLQHSRQIRKWTSEDAPISYAAWAILCDYVGIEKIWTTD